MVKDADELNPYWCSYLYRPHRYVAAPDEDYRVADQGVGSRKGRCGELFRLRNNPYFGLASPGGFCQVCYIGISVDKRNSFVLVEFQFYVSLANVS